MTPPYNVGPSFTRYACIGLDCSERPESYEAAYSHSAASGHTVMAVYFIAPVYETGANGRTDVDPEAEP